MIVVYSPSKLHLTRDETKTPGDFGWPQLAQSGHYFACGKCGNSGPIHTGEGSRLAAVLDARRHPCAPRKNEWRKQADGTWVAMRYGVGYSYNHFPARLLNLVIAATLRRVLHLGQ